MSAYYLDSSAVVKHYVEEAASQAVAAILDGPAQHDIHMSEFGRVEVSAGLARRGRGRHGLSADVQVAVHEFERDFDTRWLVVNTSAALLREAGALAVRHYLRGYDAVHLAAAIHANRQLRAELAVDLTFVSSDAALNTAAEAEGLRVLNPVDSPTPTPA